MNNILIVPAITAEVELLQQLARQTFQESFGADNTPENMKHYLQENLSLTKLSAEMGNPDSEFFFAMLKTQPVGYMKLNYKTAQSELFNSRAVELERIYVLKSHQGQQIGQMMFSRAVEAAKEVKAPFLWLGVWEHNTKAIGFYQRNGFTQFDTHPFMLGTEKQIDILMRLDLPVPKAQ